MDRVLNFSSPREDYVAEAVVVWCFDQRFETVFRKFLKRSGLSCFDPVRVAGGAKSLAYPEHESDRLFLLDQIRKSMKLHKTGTAILMLHSDCGAFGGLAAFKNDARQEALSHSLTLQQASSYLQEKVPGLTVKTYFVDFEGVWEVSAAMESAIANQSSTAR